MKFWQLVSILSDNREALRNLLKDRQWDRFRPRLGQFEQLVNIQDRTALDEVIPEELAIAAMKLSPYRFHVDGDHLHWIVDGSGYLQSLSDARRQQLPILSASEVYARFGADILFDALDSGVVRLPMKK